MAYWISKYIVSGLGTQLSVGWRTNLGRENKHSTYSLTAYCV